MATRIKYCGITRLQDAEHAVSLDAWAVGMILWPGSPRYCKPEEAAAIGAALHRRAEVAGVFVNAHLDHVVTRADEFGLTLVQLHGDEGPSFCTEVARRTGARVIKVARVRHAPTCSDLSAFHTDFHLLDAASPSCPAAPGRRSPGTARPRARRTAGDPQRRADPDNVGEAIADVGPWAVDVASGVELARGSRTPGWTAAASERPTAPAPTPGQQEPPHDRRRAPLRPLRRPVRPRDADAGARRAGGGVGRGERRRRLPRRARPAAARLRRAARRRSTWPPTLRGRRPPGLPQARGPAATPARTRSTTRSARRCSRRRMGKTRIIAETGAGQHGVATRDRLRAARPRVHRLHGRGGHAPPVARTSPHEAARRDGRAGRRGRADAQGRDQRRRSATGSRTSTTRTTSSARVVGPAPVSRRSCATSSAVIGDEARAQMLEQTGALPDARDRLRRRRLERDRHVRRRSSTTPRSSSSASRPPATGIETGRHGAPLTRGAASACSTAPLGDSCRTRTGRSSRRTRSRPGSTIPASGRSTPSCATPGAPPTSPSPTSEALAAFQHARASSRASSRRSSPRTRSPGCWRATEPGGARPRLPLRARRQGPRRGARRADAPAA